MSERVSQLIKSIYTLKPFEARFQGKNIALED